jgi:GT2 family glycosyltransferase
LDIAQPDGSDLSVVIVTFNDASVVGGCLDALEPELRPGDEVIVVDNGSTDASAQAAVAASSRARVVELGRNEGYMAACNAGAAKARGELLVLLNPDTLVAPGFGAAIRRPLTEARGWTVWQALLTQAGGAEVNTRGGVSHFTGISWAGGVGDPAAGAGTAPREVGFASSACMALRLTDWRRLGGFPEHFFLYFDDVDISFRARLEGGGVGIEPAARVEHLYDFSRRSLKWRLLERNRWATIIRTYPTALLVVLAPALAATEFALVAIAVSGGWGGQKARAFADTLRALPRLMRERRAIQARRAVTAAEFAAHLSPQLSSPFLGRASRLRMLNLALELYWAAARRLLVAASR